MSASSTFSIPVGLGLATASHLYLCHRNLLQAQQERQYHMDLSGQCEVDLLFQSLSGSRLFSELIDLLDSTLLLHSDSAVDNNNSNNNNKRTRRKSKSNRHHRSSPCDRRCFHQEQQELQQQQQQQTGLKALSSSSTNNAKSMLIDMHRHQLRQHQTTPLDLCSTSRNASAATLSRYQTPLALPPQQPAPPPTPQNQALRDHVELWTQACRQLRLSQDRESRKTIDRIRARQPSFWNLKVNIVVSLVLGAGMLAGLFKDRTPSSSLISILFSPFSSSNSGLGGTGTTSSTSGSRNFFLCGVHFLTAFRIHWTLSELYPSHPQNHWHGQEQGRSHSHLIFLERTNAVTRCLEIREKRLLYLMQHIKVHEDEQQQQQHQRSRIARPALLTSPSTTTTPTTTTTTTTASVTTETTMAGITMTSCTALTSSRNSPMDEDDIDMATGQGQISAAAGAVEVDDEILGQEPTSLVCMNMTRFLRDPVEQSRVLRMELQALKEDLESLHNMML